MPSPAAVVFACDCVGGALARPSRARLGSCGWANTGPNPENHYFTTIDACVTVVVFPLKYTAVGLELRVGLDISDCPLQR